MSRIRVCSPRLAVLASAIPALLMAACGGGSSEAGGADPPPGSVVDWTGRTARVDAPEGWSVAFCEGDAPLLCVERDGAPVGAVELLDYHVASLAEFDGDLRRWSEGVFRTIAADRRAGCGEGYELRAEPSAARDVAGAEGLRYSFSGYRDGVEQERVIGYGVVQGDTLFLLAANAYEPGGCIGTEGGEFGPADLRAFEAVLDSIAATSRFPTAAGDGAVTGFIRDRDASGRLVVDPAEMLDGEAAEQAAREDGELGPGEELPGGFYIRDRSDATVTLQLSAGADVQLYDCTAGCELRPVDAGDFLSGAAVPFNGDQALFRLTLVDGEVAGLVEIYVP